MWFFRSPKIVFGEDALDELTQLEGKRAFIVTDANMQQLGFVERVNAPLKHSGVEVSIFADVEPNPSVPTIERCARQMTEFEPDWIIGLGGGSCMDAAKAAWFRYERPDIPLEAVNPFQPFNLGRKARLATIPTTAGSGAEVTTAAVITDPQEIRKLEVASYELLPALVLIDPVLTANLPPQITADSGIDVLTHAVEGYANPWHNDFSDGISLQALQLVFNYLPRAYQNGAKDMQARSHMANAATLAGLSINNSHIALAHAMGHSAGALFGIPHGRVTGLLLPYTIEFTARGGAGRYQGLTHMLGLQTTSEEEAGIVLAKSIRDLLEALSQPLTLAEAGVSTDAFEKHLTDLCDRAEMDPSLVTSLRIPDREALEALYRAAFNGQEVTF